MSKRKNKKQKGNLAILIDAKNNVFSIVEINHYTDLYMHGKYNTFTAINIGKNDSLYVDDEGLINDTNYGFIYGGYSTPLMGNGIVLGVNPNTGDSKSVKHTIDEIVNRVQCFVVENERLVKHPNAREIIAHEPKQKSKKS